MCSRLSQIQAAEVFFSASIQRQEGQSKANLRAKERNYKMILDIRVCYSVFMFQCNGSVGQVCVGMWASASHLFEPLIDWTPLQRSSLSPCWLCSNASQQRQLNFTSIQQLQKYSVCFSRSGLRIALLCKISTEHWAPSYCFFCGGVFQLLGSRGAGVFLSGRELQVTTGVGEESAVEGVESSASTQPLLCLDVAFPSNTECSVLLLTVKSGQISRKEALWGKLTLVCEFTSL